MKRMILYFFVTLLSLLLLAIATIAVVIHFVFTPSKLSPIVEKAVSENLDAKLSLSSVELTFFRSFPNFSVVVQDGALTSLVSNDTIVSFQKLDVSVNPIALFRNRRVVVNKMELTKPIIRATIDSSGVANWDILKQGEEEVPADTTTVASDQSGSLSLSNIRIINGEILFDDRARDRYIELSDVTMSLDGRMTKEISDLKFALSFKDALFWQNGRLLAKKINLETIADLELNTKTKKIVLSNASVELNTIQFDVVGNIDPDSVDLNLSLKIPTLESVLGLASFIDKSAKVTTKGDVTLKAHLKGAYKNGDIPRLEANLSISDAMLHYEGYENGIDKLSLTAKAVVDLKGSSSVTIEKFYLLGASTSVHFSGEVLNLFHHPKLIYSTNSTINLTDLAKSVPLKKGVEIGGKIRINSQGEITEEQIQKGDYATLKASGEVRFRNVVLNAPRLRSKFEELDLKLQGNKDGLLLLDASLSNAMVNIDSNRFVGSLERALVKGAGIKSEKESYLKGIFDYKNLSVALYNDTLSLRSGHSSVAFKINEKAHLQFATDTLSLGAADNRFDLSSAKVNVTVGQKLLKGKIDFSGMNLVVPRFPLPMSMPATTILVDNDVIQLEKATFLLGDSDVELSGTVSDLIASSKGEKPLVMKVDMTSGMLNLTQIAHTLNQMSPIVVPKDSTEQIVADTSGVALFKIPHNIDFTLHTQLKRVEFGKLLVDNVKGVVTIQKGVARLEELSLQALGAKLATTVVYDSNIENGAARAGFILRSKSIDVHSVIELVPSLDTLMPMLNSFEGKLNFSLIAATKFYDGFTLHPNDIKATIGLTGEELVLLDGKTFTEISKLLMFKNKNRNIVDSVGVQMAIDNGAVEIFPFIIQIDRYRVAVGGEHLLSNQFNYHLSVLKSPIPFKFGVNITGSLDDMKVGIGKTKYKFLNEPSSVKQLNPKYVELGKMIRQRIKEL